MFRRRRREQPETVAEHEQAAPTRESGPWDADEPHPDNDRIDLGGLRLPHNPDFDVRLASVGDQHVGVVVIHGESTLQLQALAAPRSSGLWDEVKTKIRAQAKELEEREGPFGAELAGELPTDAGPRPARYLGVDGPRWFLLAVISGPGAHDEAVAGAFVDFVKDVVVVRGDEPMAREEPIPLRRPNEQAGGDGPEERPGLNPFKRGPEISEIR
ncbi:DUF3710 domain-containing protein [Actinomadura sp. ATCC 31491]|uniref:DUF3710 domain-containing protein n=1 Tax=Actinomadura luzonensis TaxID=2805427 RepID=A0ABT0FZ46_9ACTN|nr:DUF3710 domain-containing protein [Actinomadura luzonensis]MCK2217544.1 DUF3710 domain-containing protein [Actinomadura luzonensis]